MGLYTIILIGWGRLDTVGIEGWTIKGDGIRLSDKGLIFSSDGSFSYAIQVAHNVRSPRVSISLLDKCPDMYVKISLETYSKSRKQSFSARSRDSLRNQVLVLKAQGIFDSVRFRISGYSRMNTGCTIPVFYIRSNFLKNVDFSKPEVFPWGWGRRNAYYSNGVVQFRGRGSIGRYLYMKRGTIYRVRVRGKGNFRVRLNYIARKKSFPAVDSISILDTMPSFSSQVFIEITSSYGNLRNVSIEILDTLPIVLSRIRRQVYLWNNTGKEYRLYVYDSNGNIYKKVILGDSLKLKFDRKGTYLFLIPKVFRQEVRIR